MKLEGGLTANKLVPIQLPPNPLQISRRPRERKFRHPSLDGAFWPPTWGSFHRIVRPAQCRQESVWAGICVVLVPASIALLLRPRSLPSRPRTIMLSTVQHTLAVLSFLVICASCQVTSKWNSRFIGYYIGLDSSTSRSRLRVGCA